MTLALRGFSYGHGGLAVVLFALAASCVPWRPTQLNHRAETFAHWLWAIVCGSAVAELILTSWYLFSPAFLDHIEASVASNVHAFLSGAPLYPSLDSYSFGGLLYGPLLAELNSLGYVLSLNSFSAKIVGWLAGWTAVAWLVIHIRHKAPGMGGSLTLVYALSFLLSFGAEVTVARPEPLLLLFATASLGIALKSEGLAGSILLGLLCGAAVALKAHAPLYLLPSLYVWISRRMPQQWRREWLIAVSCFCGAATLALVLPFVPHNVSAASYLRYLTLATRHGLSVDLFGRNCAFVLGIWAPILLLIGSVSQAMRTTRQWRGLAFTLLGAECLVLVVASKPGAGIHHFIPFLAPHALLFQELYAQIAPTAAGRAVATVAIAVLGMVTPTAQSYGSLLAFDLSAPEQTRQRDELLELATRYPRGMIGVADFESYGLTKLRPWLTARGTPQTDYGAFMDLQLSGLSDAALSSAFARCAIPFVYMPKPGAPFTLPSFYNAQPLFSDELRREFAARYAHLAAERYFDVFACHPEALAAQ
jgi:hypothetical protein